jgi:hypothetical protein
MVFRPVTLIELLEAFTRELRAFVTKFYPTLPD